MRDGKAMKGSGKKRHHMVRSRGGGVVGKELWENQTTQLKGKNLAGEFLGRRVSIMASLKN